MAIDSPIEWTDATWNPVTGCDKVSPGCTHCYAERLALRLQAMGQRNYRDGFRLTLQPQMLELPLRWRSPRRVFVNSMSDLFHDDVPADYVQRVFDVMRRASWHRFQVLTKRANLRFLSIEPLLGPLPRLALDGIDWVIVGGESGPGARPMEESWVTSIRDQCIAAGVAFFFKQWGGVQKKRTGRRLEGRTWDELPSRGALETGAVQR